jgi:hypothetical protein
MSNERMIGEWWIGNDVAGSDHCLIKVLSHHLPGTEENHKNLSQDSRFLGKDLNLGPPEYEVEILTTQPQLTLKY